MRISGGRRHREYTIWHAKLSKGILKTKEESQQNEELNYEYLRKCLKEPPILYRDRVRPDTKGWTLVRILVEHILRNAKNKRFSV